VYRRKDGRWEGAGFVLTTAGTTKRLRVYGRTREEAHSKLTEALARHRRGVPIVATTHTVGGYLTEWLETVARRRVRPSTYRSYETYVRLYLIPGLGKKRLDRLSARDIRLFLDQVRDVCPCCAQGQDAARDKPRCCARGKCCGKRVSARTVQYLHAILRAALQHAVREDALVRNVARQVQVSAGHRPEIEPWTVAESQKFLSVARQDRLYALYAVAVGVGLRRGEALGLRWIDLDLEAGVLRVRQTVQRAGSRPEFGEPKTPRSRRTIALPAQLVDALEEHRRQQAAERASAGERWTEYGLVFTTSVGTPVEPRNLSRAFVALCKRAGVRRVRLHDLRHTCATLLLAQGVPARVVMDLLGHSAIAVTMNTYSHVVLDMQRDGLAKIAAIYDPLPSTAAVK